MTPGLAKIIEKVLISSYFESPETDLHIAENACCTEYADAWLSNEVHWLSKSRSAQSQYYTLWRWRHLGLWRWSCSSAPTYYVTSCGSGSRTQNIAINGHFSPHRMSGPLSSMTWKLYSHSGTGPCGCQNGIPLLWIRSSRCKMTCLNHWMAWCELWPRRRHNGRNTYTLPWSLRGRSRPNIILKWLEWVGCVSFRHISLILCGRFDRLGIGTWDWIFILKMRLLILLNTKRPFWSMWRTNTVLNIDVCRSQNLKASQITTLVSSAMASRFGQSSYDPYDLSIDDEEYLMPNNVTETTPRQSDCAAPLLTAARLYLNSPPELPQNCGQISPNLNDYHSDPREISRTFWLPDITNWWRQQEDTRSKYANLSNVAPGIFSIIPHGVGLEASSSLGWDVVALRQAKTTGETLCKQVVLRQFAWANVRLLAGKYPVLDSISTDNDMEMKREAEQKKLHWMAKVHDLFEMWHGSRNLRATQKESRSHNKQMTAVGYISDTEEIIKASWSHIQHYGAAAFKLSEKSPVPPALSAKNLTGGRTQL